MNMSEHGALHGMTYGCWAMGEFGLSRPARFNGQFGEDWFCWELLGRPRYGTFIEAGAYDGVSLSTTLGLQDCGWDGVLVEPLFEAYERLRARGSDDRPMPSGCASAICINAALVGPDDPPTLDIRVSDHEVYGGMTSGVVPDMEETRKWEKRTVPATTLSSLYEQFLAPKEVDILFLDVEGGEVKALKGMAGYAPRIICAEDLSLAGENGKVFEGLAGYMRVERPAYVEFANVGYNRIYVRRDVLPLAKKRFHGVEW